MARVAFIGVGNMGGPMAINLVEAGHDVHAVDRDPASVALVSAAGGHAAGDVAVAVADAEAVFTMLPAGDQVREVYFGAGGVLERARPDALLVDCSTIDVATAREVASAATARGLDMLDAPVSGGVGGAVAATLTFMVGGTDAGLSRAQPLLERMGRTVVHTGGPGNGQAAKLCNNLILGISMIGVAEAFTLAHALGLDPQKLFDVSSTSSGQCWSLTTYCPVPGPVPSSPANRDYAPGFTAEMMLKDLKLAQTAAGVGGVATPLGAAAAVLYQLAVNGGLGKKDFSAIIKMLET